jgi:ATP synthase F0 subunit b
LPPPDVSEEAQHDINWWTWDYREKHLPPPFGFAIINFAVFAAIMYKLAGKSLKEYMVTRHQRIRVDLDEAAKLRQGAQAMLLAYQKKVQGIDLEIEALLDGIRKEAEADKARIIAAAEEQARRLKAEAERQIAAEIERARNELRRGVIEAAVQAAESMLKQQIGADDQRKLAERYVADLERTTQGRKAAS